MRDKYGARDPKSWMLRFHTQTAGVSLTRQQVENNITRTAYEAMAAVLGGTNSLHTNSMDEVLALPTERAAQIALRTQQVLAHETGVTNTIDPLGGSYFIERLTDEMERGAQRYFDQIDEQGGVLRCIENGFFQREIADAAFEFERKLEANERIIVGVNAYKDGEGGEVPTLRIGPDTEQGQVRRVKAVRARRDDTSVASRLEELKTAARGTENLMPHLLNCVKAYATEGEIMAALKEVFGVYREPILF
jgi:methylmalonyl-CoA mutase N-terminal domain/subunit